MERKVPLPVIGLVAGTRAVLGIGIGLLLADRLGDTERRAVGKALVVVGVVTTFPLVAMIWSSRE